MENANLKAQNLGFTLFNDNEKANNRSKTGENESYRYVVEQALFEKLKSHFLALLKESGYDPTTVDFEQMATQIASHYAVCIENEPNESYVELILSFDSIKESVEWFWKNIEDKIEEYDAEI